MLHTNFQFWDALLLVAVTLQATAIAYVPDPQWKASIYTLPFPFVTAALAIGKPIDASNVWALALLVAYTQGVRWLHVERKFPIIASIIVCLAGYAAVGLTMTRVLHALDFISSETVFWVSLALVLLIGFLAARAMPLRAEPNERTPLPFWVKLPMTALVVLALIVFKKQMGGFTTAFPMVGVLAAYESRRSLWTMSRQVSLFVFALAPMIAACRITQSILGGSLPLALLAGVLVYLPLMVALTPSLKASIFGGFRATTESSK